MAANRLFARGTNAWTAVDSTVYTTSHAGGDGLLGVRRRGASSALLSLAAPPVQDSDWIPPPQLLPVFADHVLWPTLTKSGCAAQHQTRETALGGACSDDLIYASFRPCR